MSHLDPSSLATYNSLADPHLQSYFSNERIRSHLKHAGLISGRGEIISEGEYRSKLARRDHAKHVRHVLAENIVNRAIDMERTRQSEIKRQYEIIAKAALVNNIKETRRRSGNVTGLMTNSNDMALLSIDTSCAQLRPKSANQRNEMYDEQFRIPRLQSAHTSDDHRIKYPSITPNRRRRRHRRSSQRPKSSSINRISSAQRPRSSNKSMDSFTTSPCQITMVYYGPHTKIDYDHLVFEQIDEIIVMQQHCGGENLIVYKNHLKPGAIFTFESRRHSDYPFGLSLYVKGLIDSRISTCCEYKHRHGVKLGGERGHFAIKSVHGSKPCVKCLYEKQARLKRYAQSPKEKDDKLPITIPLPASDELKIKQTPVKIPVRRYRDVDNKKINKISDRKFSRRTSASNDNYSEDFDDSDTQKRSVRDGSSTDTSHRRIHINERKSKSNGSKPKAFRRLSPSARKESSIKSDSKFDETSRIESTKKTWQIIFHTENNSKENIRKQKKYLLQNKLLQYTFLANNKKIETEMHEINMKELMKDSESSKQYSFSTKLKNIGKPEQIRLKIRTTSDDDEDEDEDDNSEWYLDYIEVIDPETQSHLKFPCDEWIRPSQEKILQLSQRRSSSSSSRSSSKDKKHYQSPKIERKRKSSSSRSRSPPNEKSYQQSAKFERQRKTSTSRSRSPSSDKNRQESLKIEQTTKISSRSRRSSNSSKQSQTKIDSARRISVDNQSNKSEEITPRNDDTTSRENKIRYRVIIYSSHYDDGEFNPNRDSQMYLRLNNQIKETNIIDKTKQLCPSFDSNEKQEFELDLIQDINEQPEKLTIGYINSDPSAKTWKLEKIVLINVKTGDETIFPCNESLIRNESNFRAEQTFEIQLKELDDEGTPKNQKIKSPKSDNEEEIQSSKRQQQINNDNNKNKNKERSSSFQSMNDNDANYRTIFKQLDPDNQLELGSSRNSSSPSSTNRQDEIKKNNKNPIIDPLVGLDNLTDQTPRSNDQLNHNSLPHTTIESGKHLFKPMYPPQSTDDEDD
ncbi:unnamed protein product [Rotaria sp. Silwood1]|nr:unnamed protein product [Rotaria sp. Silwood1]